MAIVRPEFRTDIYIPAPDDPVFVADQCAVGDCDRTAVSIRRGLCNAHAIRFRKQGRPPMEDFLADPGPPVRGRRPLTPCTVDGCRYARNSVITLATRAANAGMFDKYLEACPDEAPNYPFGREPHGAPSPPWNWQEPTS